MISVAVASIVDSIQSKVEVSAPKKSCTGSRSSGRRLQLRLHLVDGVSDAAGQE
jgi:hypothetical protein